MKDIKDIILCNYRREDLEVHVKASIIDGSLTISGDDLGQFVRSHWGDDDYEYLYEIDAAGTKKLLITICGTDDPADALVREFSGLNGCNSFRDICDRNGIKYRFFSYA